MASEFKGLLQSIAKRLEPQELRVLVESLHLPDELKDQPGEVVLDTLGGSLSLHNLEFVIDAMREIGRNDLYQEVKLFKKTSGKKLPNGVHATPPPENGYSNFDIAESQAVNVRNTLLNMEGSDAITVYRVEEVYTEAREAAENLVRLVRHASRLSRLSRTLHPPRGSEPFSSPPECSDFKDPSSPPVTGFSKRFVKTLTKSTKSKPKEKEKSVSQKKFKRSQSARVIKKATLPVPVTIDDDEDSTASDYDVPDFPPPIGDPNAPARSSQTEPRQVPARQHALTSVNQTSPRDAFTLPRQAIPHQGGHQPRRKEPQRPPLAHHKVPSDSESNSEADYDDADTVMFTMQTSVDKKSGLFNGKPDSLQSDGSLRGRHFSRSNSYQSSTCSTPSGETVTPPATLPKPPLKGKIVTPSIPIRQSCVGVGTMKSGHQNSVSSGPNSLQSRADTTTPNRRMVDVREALRLRQAVGSPQSVTSGGSSASSSRIVSPHPISLAKALEMCSDCTGDSECPSQCSTLVSAFPPYVPSNPTSSMKKMVLPPPTRAKPKMMRPEPQQDYANIGIISTVSPPSTSPPQQHTDVSQLAPIYSTRSSQTPSPTSSDHTTIGGMGPMYKTITVEEQELLEQQEDVCPDYINVKQYVEPVF